MKVNLFRLLKAAEVIYFQDSDCYLTFGLDGVAVLNGQDNDHWRVQDQDVEFEFGQDSSVRITTPDGDHAWLTIYMLRLITKDDLLVEFGDDA